MTLYCELPGGCPIEENTSEGRSNFQQSFITLLVVTVKDTMRASFENNLPRRLVLSFVLVEANEVGGSRLLISEHTRDREGLLTVALLREVSGDTEAVFGGKGF